MSNNGNGTTPSWVLISIAAAVVVGMLIYTCWGPMP